MQTNAELKVNEKQHLSVGHKNLQKQQDGKGKVKETNVITIDYKKMKEIFLTDPDSVTREEFLLFQSAVGYCRALQLLNEGKRRKQLRKIDGNVKSIQKDKEQETIRTKEQNVIQNQKISQVSQKSDNEIIQKNELGKNTSSSTSLPSNLKKGLENLSGIELSDVSVHKNSNKPQQVGALAYTQGNDIHIAPGQEKHLPHEGWHAVQQKQGRVKPTMQMKAGTLVNNDSSLEKEADVMGAKAVSEGTQTKSLQPKKLTYMKPERNVVQGFFGKLSSAAKKLTNNILNQGAKFGSSAIKTASNIVNQGVKAGVSGIKTVSSIVKQGAKAGTNGLKTVEKIVKQGAKAGTNGLKTVEKIVKQGAKAGANGLKTVEKIVKQGAKAVANGLKTVSSIVKQGAKAGTNGLKIAESLVELGGKAGEKALKTISNLIKKGSKLGEKGLETAYNVVKQGIKNEVELGSGIIKKAKKQLSQAGGIKQNLSKRLSKFFATALNEVKNNPQIVFDVLNGNVKLPYELTKNAIENFNKNDNMEWNDKLMYAFKGTSLYKSFLNITRSGKMQSFFDLAGFDRDEKGKYHAQQDALQIYGGYNDAYDFVFDLATSMGKYKMPFESGGEEYVIWLWKGDYLNLGAGAEIGIYTGGEPHWLTDESLAMPMTLSLKDTSGKEIFTWNPKEKNWWCTGFDPMEQNRKVDELIAQGKLDFSIDKKHKEMYKDFKKFWQDEKILKFDDQKYTVTFEWR